MIERLFIRDLLTFKELDLELKDGLVVFTGPSGAGKSLLISSILSSFGYNSNLTAKVCEVNISKPSLLTLDSFDLDDNLTIKTIKKDKARVYLNNQTISKKLLKDTFSPYIEYLSVRDQGTLTSSYLLSIIDSTLLDSSKDFKKLYKEYTKRHKLYLARKLELEQIKAKEATLIQEVEFIKYEIEKIEKVSPVVGEVEELLEMKKYLSKIDKVKQSIDVAKDIFNFESSVEEVYRLLDKDSSMFNDAMNQLRVDFDDIDSLTHKLEDVDVEEVLDRLSDITSLINLYGSIEETLAYKELKQKELNSYSNIEQDKSMLESFIEMESIELYALANKLSSLRESKSIELEEQLSLDLQTLKMPQLKFVFSKTDMSEHGIDSVDISLNNSSLSTLSGGEFNRLRLALMSLYKSNKGILILDEIDANVSGAESIAIANLIDKLSKNYQIFAISHQPHLASIASQHILVTKEGETSMAKELNSNQKIDEIVRIVAGDKPTNEAVEFSKKLLFGKSI